MEGWELAQEVQQQLQAAGMVSAFQVASVAQAACAAARQLLQPLLQKLQPKGPRHHAALDKVCVGGACEVHKPCAAQLPCSPQRDLGLLACGPLYN